MNRRNTRGRWEICSKWSLFWRLYCYLWTYFAPFSSVSIVDLKQVMFGGYGVFLPEFLSSRLLRTFIRLEMGLSPSTKIVFVFFNERSWWNMMKNAFYFILKALFFFEIFMLFLSWFYGFVEKRLGKKTKDNFKIYGGTDWTRSKDNQKMKLGQLIEYNMINIFHRQYHTQYVIEKLVSGSFIKNQSRAYLWINILESYKVCFHYMSKSRST